MLGGWVLDLSDGGDAIQVEFVEVFSGLFLFLIVSMVLREYIVLGRMFPCKFKSGCCIGKYLLVVIMIISNSLASKKWYE